ncbi:MAG: DNA mismatch repair endonuclease MutL [Oscillospiraceae bacterium]
MPQKIQVLDRSVARLIAAGEVVERPASVVKELVENSIDAGSRVITIDIENGGISKIRVTDDGIGIEKESVKTAFLPHATSKLHSPQDLENIATLGFRGEALASIAAVSKISIITRTKDELIGTRYELDALDETYFDDEGCSVGTTIIVKDLFFNVPARMKFLKKDATEAAIIGSLVDKLALSHPEISFKFIKDGSVKLHTPGNGKLILAIFEVFGKDAAKSMLPLCYQDGNFKIEGYIIHPGMAKSTRNFEYFFINNRYVKHSTLISALESGYKNKLVQGRYPVCVLNITVPYNFVDVNVHPAKTDVKFSDDKLIYGLVYGGTKTALEEALQPTITKDAEPELNNFNKAEPNLNSPTIEDIKTYLRTDKYPKSPQLKQKLEETLQQNLPDPEIDLFNTSNSNLNINTQNIESQNYSNLQQNFSQNQSAINNQQTATEPELEHQDVLGSLEFIGEVLKTYIICQSQGKMVIIDKHAAHERLLFEQLKNNSNSQQMLLEPILINLSQPEYVLALENKEVFLELGFQVEDFGEGTVAVRSLPLDLQEADVEELIENIIKDLLLGKSNISLEKRDRITYAIACKAAIKSNDINTESELKYLVEKLNHKKGLVCCPHGRPVCCVIEEKELKKWFLRT